MNELRESISADFFQRALIEAVLVGALAGATGVHVMLRRLPFFVVAMTHATFPGVVLAGAAGFSVFLGGWAAAAVVILGVVALGGKRAIDDSSAIGVVLAGTFAVGVVIAGIDSEAGGRLTGFLVGSILTVDSGDLIVTALTTAVVALVLALLHKELVMDAFDRSGAEAQGYRSAWLDLCVLAVVGVVVVSVMPAVGALLAVALLTVPAMTARLWLDRIGPMMALAAALGAVAAVGGLVASTVWPVAAGGAIALGTVAIFTASFAARAAVNAVGRRAALAA